MQLQQIQRFDIQVLPAALHKGRQILAIVSLSHVGVKSPPGLGRHVDLLGALFQDTRYQTLAASIAVHISGVNEVDTLVDGSIQRIQRVFLTDISPISADGPATKADLRNLPTNAAKRPVVHFLTS